MHNATISRKIFLIFNNLLMALVVVTCLFPIMNLLAVSLSSGSAADAGLVGFFPVRFTVQAYIETFYRPEFWRALIVSVQRVGLGLFINLSLTILLAYPLSKKKEEFWGRSFYMGMFMVCMIFSGGMIPLFITISQLRLIDTMWALILPGSVNFMLALLLMNFFRGVPKELEEAAFMDGASHLRALITIYIPLSLPALATLTIFIVMGHWNDYFGGMLYLNSPEKYPLATYLQRLIRVVDLSRLTAEEMMILLDRVSGRTSKAAQTFITILPILLTYPFLQKYFVKGLFRGGIKG